jgi:hypothetical protein
MLENQASQNLVPIKAALARMRVLFYWIVILAAVGVPLSYWVTTNWKIAITTRLLFGLIGIAELLSGLHAIVMIWRYRNLVKVPLWIRLTTKPGTLLWAKVALRTSSWLGYKNVRIDFWFVDGKRHSVAVNPKQVETLLKAIREIAPSVHIG